MRRLSLVARWLSLAAIFAVTTAHAHSASDSYLTLEARNAALSGRWDIALRDLDYVLGLDANADGRLTWGEVRLRSQDIAHYALPRLTVRQDATPCAINVIDASSLERHADGTYLVLQLAGRCASAPRELEVTYDLLFDADTTHRGLLKLVTGIDVRTAVFAPTTKTQRFAAARAGAFETFGAFVVMGIQHILSGYDHLLFLFSLLLPAVAVRERSTWVAATSVRPVAADVLRTVTAFTAAHSITFMLAAYGTVTLPSRFVEAAIAASVVLAAANNLLTVLEARRWLAAFGFGLVHGFGFASVLTGLELPPGPGRALPLLGFNLGVELGQLGVVALVLPPLFLLRTTTFYRRAVLAGGSALIAVIAATWFCERAFAWTLPIP